ncbi:MAG: hypothetical protein VX184_02420 [Candidatus Thermoplasmatota archaeon]|nr:hypothetical protein [Candidatus Thermoplasmatota archaeon]
MEDSKSNLPTPYSDSGRFGRARQRALSRRVAARDAGRRLWTRLSVFGPSPSLRTLISALAPVSAALLLTDWSYAYHETAIGIFAVLTLLLIPTNLAALFSRMSARDRLKLRDGNKSTMDAYPGVERILNSLQERLLRERIRIFSSSIALFLVFAVWETDAGSTLENLLLVCATVLGALCLWNSFFLDDSIPMRSNSFPLLSLHAPTLHNSILIRPLSDLMVAHLDPETAAAWDEWKIAISDSVREDQTPGSAIEHLLRALHLNTQGLLDDERLLTEAKQVFKVRATDQLIDTGNKFNLKSLRTLMAHTKAWEPGLFRLIDRLQDAAIRRGPSLISTPWRLDLDIPPRCSQGQADLFVMLHNNTDSAAEVSFDILTAEGEPSLQTIGVESKPSRRIRRDGASDLVETLGRLLDDATVLWLGLAWPDTKRGSHPVQVTLNGERGETLSAMVVKTTLSPNAQQESAAQRMAEASSSVRRLALSMAD